MNFLRLSRQQLTARRRQWQQYLILKHYDINWSKLAPYLSLEMHTPLFQLTIYRLGRPLIPNWNSKAVVIFSCNFLKPAQSSTLINTHRSTILQTINRSQFHSKSTSIIQVSLHPAARMADEQEVTTQLSQMLASSQPTQKKRAARLSPSKLTSPSDFSGLLRVLFPFRLGPWLTQCFIPPVQLRQFMIKNKRVEVQTQYRPHWVLCHCYVLRLGQSQSLAADLVELKMVLDKFNFLAFLDDSRIKLKSETKYEALVLRLIRNLRWRSPSSEDYLAFLLRTFGGNNLLLILQDFQLVAEQTRALRLTTDRKVD